MNAPYIYHNRMVQQYHFLYPPACKADFLWMHCVTTLYYIIMYIVPHDSVVLDAQTF